MHTRFLALVLAASAVTGVGRADPNVRLPVGTAGQADPTETMNAEVVRLHGQGRDQEALPIAQRVIELREQAFGDNDVRVADGLTSLAVVYVALGQYDRAASLHERVVRILENAPEQFRPALARGLNNLGDTFARMGRYDQALPLLERSLRIQEAIIGSNHPDVAISLVNQAETLRLMGNYERALQLNERATQILESAFGLNHPNVAVGYNNLAATFVDMGQYTRAVPFLERSLRVYEICFGPNHPGVARSLNNLAVVFDEMGQQDRSAPLYERSLAIWEAVSGPNHPDVATGLNNLAETLRELGQFDRAAPLHERALRIRENVLGVNHPDVAVSLNNLASILFSTGQDSRALQLYERSFRVWEAALGPNHPTGVISLMNQADVLDSIGQFSSASATYERALTILAQNIGQVASHQREDAVRLFLRSHRGDRDTIISFAISHRRDAHAARLALTATLLFKARGEEETTATLAVIRRDGSPETRELLERWIDLQRRVSVLDERTPRAEREHIEEELRITEERLARLSVAARERRQLTDTAGLVSRVARHLAPGTALIEIASFKPYNPRVRVQSERFGSPHYAAFVLHTDGTLGVVDLGESAPIDALARALLPEAHGPRRSPEDVARAGHALYARLFAPVQPLLRPDTRRLILAPDGDLHFAPLHLMHDGAAWLMDRYTVSYVTTGRDLLRERSAEDLPSAPVAILATHYSTPAWEIRGLASQRFAIPRLLPGVHVFDDAAATERALLDVSAPQILHVGAHGYFATRGPQTYAVMQRGRLLLGDALADPATTSLPAPVPVVRDDGHDGVVTAAELLPVNLRGTRLVVLSACDTAVGEASVGDGVLGLRRAFLLAGAEALVTTQWAVEERPGNVFTVALYEGLRAGLRYADAVTRAMRVVRARDPDPFAWAPFILVGRDEAIDWNSPLQTPAAGAPLPPAS